MPVSGDTLLRLVRRATPPLVEAVRVLGIDDWAWRKGQRYGTILVDLERRRVLDLLPDRETATASSWRKQHPTIEVVSRDRASAYADAARQGAPQAQQVADRWHLLKNTTEAFQQVLERKHAERRQAAQWVRSVPPAPAAPLTAPTPSGTRLEVQRQARREQRQAQYEEVVRRRRQGVSAKGIVCELGLGRNTVRRWLQAGQAPEHRRSGRRSRLDR